MNNEEKILGILGAIQADMEGLKSDVSGLKSDVSELKSDVSGLKSDVSGLKSDVSELKSDVSGLKSDVSELKSDVSELKTRVTKIEIGMENEIIPSIKLLAEGQQTILETMYPRSEAEELKERVEFLESVVRLHAREINELKKAQ